MRYNTQAVPKIQVLNLLYATLQTNRYLKCLLCDIPRIKAPRTSPCHTWRNYRRCPSFGRETNTDSNRVVWMILLASACYGNSRVAKHFLRKTFFAPKLGLPTNLGAGWSWLFPASSIKLLSRRSLKSQWVYLAPHEDNSIQLLSTVRSVKWKNNFMVHLKVRRLIE